VFGRGYWHSFVCGESPEIVFVKYQACAEANALVVAAVGQA
jgi:hypothetical protein